MLRRLLAFTGVFVLTGALVPLTAGLGLAAGPHGGVFQRGGGFAPPRGGMTSGGPSFNPRSIYPPLGYDPSRLYPYYSYNYNYGPYNYNNRPSTSYYYSSGYGEFPGYPEYTEPFPEGAASYGQGYPARRRAENFAHLAVSVPKGAEVWFDGFKTASTGPVRDFKTPPLDPGKYAYTVRARWSEDGHEVTQKQEVIVSPGADIQLSFPLPHGSKEGAGNAKER